MTGKWILAAALISAGVLALAEAEKKEEGGAWENVRSPDYALAVPKGWKQMKAMRTLLALQGDKVGAPAADETVSPIQINMSLEKFAKPKPPASEKTASENAKDDREALKKNERVTVVTGYEPETVKLSDGTEAVLQRTLFIRDGSRKTLQMKLFAMDKGGNCYVATSMLAVGLDSKFIENNEAILKRMRAHVTSLCFDRSKFDPSAVEAAYAAAKTQPATASAPAEGK